MLRNQAGPAGRFSARAAALAVLATLVVASPAAAATHVGSPNLSSPSTGDLVCDFFPCVLVLDQVDGADVATPKGVITSWSVRKATGTVALRVLRGRSGEFVPNELHATNISESADQAGSGSDTVQTFDAHQPVAAGDYIGITLVTGSSIGYLIGSGDQIFEVGGDTSVNDVDDPTPDNFEPLLSATVEPDADGDGFGDESEDACPSSAATNGACPIVRSPPPSGSPLAATRPSTAATGKVRLASRSATFTRGKASIKLKNANAVGIKGKLKLKLGKKIVGARAYSLAAGAAGTVKVKLAKVARKRIGRRGRVKLSLSLTAKGATGATFKTAAKLTVKKPAKKRRRTTIPPGGSALDGTYGKDPSSGPDLRFTVTGGGRKIEKLTGSVGGFCYTLAPFGGGLRSEFRTLFAGTDSIAVAADGTFAGSQKLSDTTTEITNGRLASGIATGTVRVKSPGCTGTASFKSRRTGR
jgi:hypothetical protein